MANVGYVFDPNDPRAPTDDQWLSMTEAQRRAVVDALPSELPRGAVPEGDAHRVPKERALEALREWFRKKRRGIYLSAELPIYYPGRSLRARRHRRVSAHPACCPTLTLALSRSNAFIHILPAPRWCPISP